MDYYARAVEAVNRNIQHLDTACSDENIIAVSSLAHHKISSVKETAPARERRPSQGPLNALRLLDMYGGPIRPAVTHTRGLLKMIELRGGVNAITCPGLAHQSCYEEVIEASRTLQPPRLDFAPCLALDLEFSLAINHRIDHPLREMGSGFDVLLTLDDSQRCTMLRSGLRRMALYSLGVDDYIAGRPARKSLHILAEERLYVQHTFLSMLWMQSGMAASNQAPIITVCHLAGVIYSLQCVFPLPTAPFELVVRQLTEQFAAHDFAHEWTQAPQLMIWIIVMLGIAAVDMPEQSWAVAVLDRCVRRLNVASWDDLKILLLKYLWLPITNDPDGMDLWDEIARSNPLSFQKRPT